LTILLAALAAVMLVPAAQALAHGTVTVHIEGTGSGELSSVGGLEGSGFYEGSPPIECDYASPGPASGTCTTELVEEEIQPGVEGLQVNALVAPGSKLLAWQGDTSGCGMGTPPACLFVAFGESPAFEVTAVICLEGQVFSGGTCHAPIYNLKLNFEEGEGTVVSNPAGLECTGAAPESCEAEVSEGTYTLTASPAPGYAFKSWKGCDSGGVNGRQCTVTVGSSLKQVGAKFYKVFSLGVKKSGGMGILSTSPGGINCGYACTAANASYKAGSALTVKAKPAKHFHFVEFTGGEGAAGSCNGVTTPECTIASLSSNSDLTEVYAEDAKHTLTLQKSDRGQGSVKTKPTNINCGLTCNSEESEFFASESAEVTVTLGKGTTQATWISGAGSCTGHALTCTIPMSENHLVVVGLS